MNTSRQGDVWLEGYEGAWPIGFVGKTFKVYVATVTSEETRRTT